MIVIYHFAHKAQCVAKLLLTVFNKLTSDYVLYVQHSISLLLQMGRLFLHPIK